MSTEELPIVVLFGLIGENLAIAIPILAVLFGLLIGYYVLMVRAVLQMLRLEARAVLLTFAFLCMIPFPLVLILGALILVIWKYHRPVLEAGRAASRT